ncbi:DUF2894 domain-containing protein [Variovorax sp. Root411]|uniref:DUF2894 domain-containing protein n=1 Tax=Variovorax sp. Root411 TaxID=1736530 RepID=UPI0006FE18AB|nr:hypothetical protein ASC92_23255 [Variovorax sp. Root411]
MVAASIKRGDHRFDPVRFRVIEAMARRAAAYGGEARRILDDKVTTLLAAYGEDLEKAQPTDVAKQEAAPERGALAGLVDHIAQNAPVLGDSSAPVARNATRGLSASSLPSTELKSIRYFKSTWSKLSADRRLTQSLAKVPENAGPLNSHHLVHRSLTLMRDLSPEYLNRFMSYVDALSWVDQLNGGNAATGAASPRAEGPARKSGRGKSA